MIYYKTLILLIITLSLQTIGQAHNDHIDSLISSLEKAKKDSVLINNYIYVSSYFYEKNLNKSNFYARKAFNISHEIGYIKGQAQSLFSLAQTEHKFGKLKNALRHYQQSAILFKNKKEIYFEGRSNAEAGNVYGDLGDMVNAIKNHQKAIQSFKKLNNKMGIATCFSDLGRINHAQKNHEQSLVYYKKAKDIFKKSKDKASLAKLYNRVSLVFRDKEEIEKSLDYNYKALLIQEQFGDKSGMAQSNFNIGETNIILKDWSRAKGFIDYSLKLYRDIGDQIGISKCYLITAKIALLQNQVNIATSNLMECIDIAKKSSSIPQLIEAYGVLARIYEDNKKYDKAFKYLRMFNALKDSLYSVERTRQFSEMEIKFQTETIEEKLEEVSNEKEVSDNKALTFTLSFFLGLIIFIVIIFMMKKKNKESEETNKHLEKKNRLIKKKNNEILDSILYAKRIQEAMLTSSSYIEHIFEEHLIIYNPKDIVSGDFYWAYNHKNSNTVYWATADCTGHGVPGALMSMIGTVLLNEAVIIKKEVSPGRILMQINAYLQRYLNKADTLYQTQDGIDISFCKLNKNTLTLEFAGAAHSVYIIRNGQLTELKGDKITLGQDPYGRIIDEFLVSEFQLENNDIIYTFTDGFSDQIGGPDKKKFKVGALKQLLIEISNLTMENQRIKIKKTLSLWQGENTQLDDILIMGVRV